MKNTHNKIANFLKLGTLLLGFSLLLWNCEKDQILEKHEKELVINEYQLSELESKVILKKSINKLNTLKTNNNSKSTNNNDVYNFTIVPNKVKEIIKGDVISYVFLIERPFKTFGYFENLVIEKKEDKTIRASIIKYTLNNSIELFKNHNSFRFDAKISIYLLDLNDVNNQNKSSSCGTVEQYWCSWQFDHIAGPSCLLATDGRIYIKWVVDENCGTISSGVSSGGGGGDSSSSEPDPIITSPLSPEGDKIKVINAEVVANQINSALNFSLSPEEMGWLIEHPTESSSIDIFLKTNNTPEAKTFAQQAIEALMDGVEINFDGLVDNTDSPCVGAIITSIQQKDTNGSIVPDLVGKSHLSQVVLDLFGKCKNYDLLINVDELGVGPNGGEINAKTNGINSITLDEDLINEATQLSIAKTLIHESLHLFMNWMVRKSPNSDLTKDLKAYFDKYNNNSNLSHHQFMSQYVEALAYSLSAYDNHRQDMSYYIAMSWAGLESSDAYKALPNKTAIQTIIINEREAKRDAKSTKCN